MISAVYDTNILASGTISSGTPVAHVIDAWINDEVTVITSQPLLDELGRTFTKKYFTDHLSQEQIQGYLNIIKARAIIVPITAEIPHVATHPEDDVVLATAESGKADYIVSGDNGLLGIELYKSIQIVNAKTFLDILSSTKRDFCILCIQKISTESVTLG